MPVMFFTLGPLATDFHGIVRIHPLSLPPIGRLLYCTTQEPQIGTLYRNHFILVTEKLHAAKSTYNILLSIVSSFGITVSYLKGCSFWILICSMQTLQWCPSRLSAQIVSLFLLNLFCSLLFQIPSWLPGIHGWHLIMDSRETDLLHKNSLITPSESVPWCSNGCSCSRFILYIISAQHFLCN